MASKPLVHPAGIWVGMFSANASFRSQRNKQSAHVILSREPGRKTQPHTHTPPSKCLGSSLKSSGTQNQPYVPLKRSSFNSPFSKCQVPFLFSVTGSKPEGAIKTHEMQLKCSGYSTPDISQKQCFFCALPIHPKQGSILSSMPTGCSNRNGG